MSARKRIALISGRCSQSSIHDCPNAASGVFSPPQERYEECAITFIAAGFLFRTFASPVVAFLPFGAVLLTYFGLVRFPYCVPGGLVAVLLGTALAWGTHLVHFDVKMGLFNVIGSLQNLDSASAAGDDYRTVPSLVANGVGTLIGAGFCTVGSANGRTRKFTLAWSMPGLRPRTIDYLRLRTR